MRSGETLREDALRALGTHGDPRAYAALSHATVEVLPGVRQWEGSSGHQTAHAIVVRVDAHTLGRLWSHPSAYDAICSVIAVAMAKQPGESVDEVRLQWEPPHLGAVPYRSSDGPARDDAVRFEPSVLREGVGTVLAAHGSTLAGADCELEVKQRDGHVEIRWRVAHDTHVRELEEATWLIVGGLPERRLSDVTVSVRVA